MAEEVNASSVLSVTKTVGSKITELPVKNGQLTFVTDTHQIYFDYDGIRKYYCDIDVYSTEEQLLKVVAPIVGFYYTSDTNILWRYATDTGWKQLTPRNLTPIIFDTLPTEGVENTLYIDGKSIKRWNGTSYEIVADVLQWDSI